MSLTNKESSLTCFAECKVSHNWGVPTVNFLSPFSSVFASSCEGYREPKGTDSLIYALSKHP